MTSPNPFTPKDVRMTYDTSTLTQLVDALAGVQDRLGPLRDLESSLKAQIREVLATDGPGEYAAGNRSVSLTGNRRLDLAAIAKAHPVTEYPGMYDLVIDPKKVRASLPPAEVERYMTTVGDLRVSVK